MSEPILDPPGRTRQYGARAALPLLCVVAATMLHNDIFQYSVVRAIAHITLLSILLYGLLALVGRFKVLRAAIGLIIATEIFVELSYGSSMSLTIMMSILNTSPGGALSFLQFHFPELLLFLTIVTGMTVLPVAPQKVVKRSAAIIGLAYLVMPTILAAESMFSSEEYFYYMKSGTARKQPRWQTNIEFFVADMANRFPPLSFYRAISDTVRFANVETDSASSWTNVSRQSDSPKLLVIGIGESLRAGNMSLYSYPRITTPRLSAMADDLDIYRSAYSAGTNTWGSIPTALTKYDARPDISKSIINLAKDAGFETYWLSNKTKYSQYDFSVTKIAEQADHVYFTADEGKQGDYDEILLTKLQTILDAQDADGAHRLIILNFAGSHLRFADRYPPEFARFGDGKNKLDRYDNSILYTDHVQAELLSLVQRNGGKYLFFADHGLGHPDGDYPLRHDVQSDPGMDSLEVPFFTTRDHTLQQSLNSTVSLFYFECIFAKWSRISATELEDQQYCERSLGKNKITYVDSSLQMREQ